MRLFLYRTDVNNATNRLLGKAKYADYYKKRAALDHEIDKTLSEIQRILGIEIKMDGE